MPTPHWSSTTNSFKEANYFICGVCFSFSGVAIFIERLLSWVKPGGEAEPVGGGDE